MPLSAVEGPQFGHEDSQQSWLLQWRQPWGGFPLVGCADKIADSMEALSEVGLDGALLSWPQYSIGLRRFIQEVLPLLEKRKLRAPLS